MKAISILLLSLAGFASAQSLPYQYEYKNERGWREAVLFEQSPSDPSVILISRYSYVDAQTPFWQFKETKHAADTKQTLAFIAQRQANERAATGSQASAQDVKDHYKQQQLDRQKQGEEMDAEMKDQKRERRLKKLERAEQDRLNRERSPHGK